MKYIFVVTVLLFTLFSCQQTKEKVLNDHTVYVDPFIGTGGHGHTYPGATVPFGMLQVSPDNSITIGFSHLHLSGTGIGDLADIRFMPVNKKVDLSKEVKSRDDVPYKSAYSHKEEIASPGYYSVNLIDHSVKVELSSNLRTAYHKYTFSKNDLQSMVIDLGFAINWDKSTDTKISIVDDHTISGYRHSTGWAKNQKVFFVAEFSKPFQSYDLVKNRTYITESESVTGEKTFAQIFFNNEGGDIIQVKVGISSVSEENAKEKNSISSRSRRKQQKIGITNCLKLLLRRRMNL